MTEDNDRSFGDIIVGFVVFFVLGVPVLLLQGWVVSTMWRWYVVPLGLPSFGCIQGAGLCAFRMLFAKGTTAFEKYETLTGGMITMAFIAVLVPLFILGFAAIIHSWM